MGLVYIILHPYPTYTILVDVKYLLYGMFYTIRIRAAGNFKVENIHTETSY